MATQMWGVGTAPQPFPRLCPSSFLCLELGGSRVCLEGQVPQVAPLLGEGGSSITDLLPSPQRLPQDQPHGPDPTVPGCPGTSSPTPRLLADGHAEAARLLGEGRTFQEGKGPRTARKDTHRPGAPKDLPPHTPQSQCMAAAMHTPSVRWGGGDCSRSMGRRAARWGSGAKRPCSRGLRPLGTTRPGGCLQTPAQEVRPQPPLAHFRQPDFESKIELAKITAGCLHPLKREPGKRFSPVYKMVKLQLVFGFGLVSSLGAWAPVSLMVALQRPGLP